VVLDGDVNVRFPLEILPVEASINPEPFKDELAEDPLIENVLLSKFAVKLREPISAKFE
jgi:hypothetical protein